MHNGEDGETAGLSGLFARLGVLSLLGKFLTFAWVGKRGRLLFVPLLLVAAAAAGLGIDCPLARWCVEDNCPEVLARLFGVAEPFGNGLGVLLVLLAVYALDPVRRWAIGRVMVMSLGAGLAADAFKMLIVRVRPHRFNFDGSVMDTFGRWLPLVGVGSGRQSFPSAHTATAVGLAIALAWLYPRGRWLFAALVVLVACQRMELGAHYWSDTLAGAAVGWLVAMACIENAWLAAWFDRLELRYKSRREWATPSVRPVRSDHLTVDATAQEDQSRAA